MVTVRYYGAQIVNKTLAFCATEARPIRRWKNSLINPKVYQPQQPILYWLGKSGSARMPGEGMEGQTSWQIRPRRKGDWHRAT